MEWAHVLGRICVPIVHLVGAYGKFTNQAGTVGYITNVGKLPYADLIAWATPTFELIAGLMILIGWKTKWAAWALIVFILLATYFFHPFWAQEGQMAAGNQFQALKNLSIIGALLLLIAAGPGPCSVDGRKTNA